MHPTATDPEEIFQQRRNSFTLSNDLALDPHYHGELNGPPHVYPNSSKEVMYMSRPIREDTRKPMAGGQVGNTSLYGMDGPKNLDGNLNVIFTRRGSVDDLMMMEKDEIDQSGSKPMLPVLKSNHSTFNSGGPVANAGFLSFAGTTLQHVELNSGHYAPDHSSGVKLAMWAEHTGAFNPTTVPILDHDNHQVDVGRQAQVDAVNHWATSHPKVLPPVQIAPTHVAIQIQPPIVNPAQNKRNKNCCCTIM